MSLQRPTAREIFLDVGSQSLSGQQIDVAEKNFFNQIRLANGTLKTTSVNRLSDVNRVCNGMLAQTPGRKELLDVGISSGVTTIEWMDDLDSEGIQYQLDGFDLCLDGYIHSVADWFHVLCDSAGNPLQFEVHGKAIGNHFGETLGSRLKRIVPVYLLRLAYAVARNHRGNEANRHSVRLATHRLRERENLRLFEFDIMRSRELDKRYDMIRAANILNLDYFSDEFLAAALQSLGECLDAGGMLCVVRTRSDGSNHGSLFEKAENGFNAVQRIGDGSEIEHIVLSAS